VSYYSVIAGLYLSIPTMRYCRCAVIFCNINRHGIGRVQEMETNDFCCERVLNKLRCRRPSLQRRSTHLFD